MIFIANYILKKNDFFYELVLFNKNASDGGASGSGERDRDYAKESAQRAKAKIKDLSLNNMWTHFLTLTVDPQKMDRFDYEYVKKRLVKAFNNYQQRYDRSFKYIVKAELHKDGAIHFHGLIYMDMSNQTNKNNIRWSKKASHAARMRHKRSMGVWRSDIHVYEWIPFVQRFGFTHLTGIYNRSEFIAYYMSKYITKDDDHIFWNFYFRSKGLNQSEIKHEGDASKLRLPSSHVDYYEGQFTTVYQLNEEQYLEMLQNKSFQKY